MKVTSEIENDQQIFSILQRGLCLWIIYSDAVQRGIQSVTIKHIYLTPYLCIEWSFDRRPFINNKMFKEKPSQKLVAHIFTLLLAPFAFKLVNHSSHSEISNFHKISKSTSFSFQISDFTVFKHISKTHCVSKNWPILTQNMPKEPQRCELPTSVSAFPKIFCCSLMVGGQKIVHYIRMV